MSPDVKELHLELVSDILTVFQMNKFRNETKTDIL